MNKNKKIKNSKVKRIYTRSSFYLEIIFKNSLNKQKIKENINYMIIIYLILPYYTQLLNQLIYTQILRQKEKNYKKRIN